VRALALGCVVLAACEVPPLTIKFMLTDGESQQCTADNNAPTTSCEDITLACDGVVSIRVVPPNEPEVPYISVCQALPTTGSRKLCSIAGIDLPQPKSPIPEQVLEVQMAVFERSDVGVDEFGNLECPIVQFGVNGLPVMEVEPGACSTTGGTACQGRPAVGGRAFYHPGDSETLIKLGCTELDLVRGEACTGLDRTDVIATVNDFESPGLDLTTANRLSVGIGEPVPGTPPSYYLDSSLVYQLPRAVAPLPTWSAQLSELGFDLTYCVDVDEDVPLATRTVTCRPLPITYPDKIDAVGTRLKPELLSTILKAANLTAFPSKGLVVGIVVNEFFTPLASTTVLPSCASCSVKYLSQDKLSFNMVATSSNGIWISEDAPYGTTFARSSQPVPMVFGGLVDNKVTIVVIQDPGTGG
jgi:hypothetical protein